MPHSELPHLYHSLLLVPINSSPRGRITRAQNGATIARSLLRTGTHGVQNTNIMTALTGFEPYRPPD
ncbi:hypothetical protein ASPCADRAFT_208448 [Aspergillus carbonarius ITEM 5010]|uniref:Uncharacterized protein n=1 Tax=Aspergillus carbonarius (strain ITEM 5010) TaxID=602072 RepID=A0A1R3RJY3_ASPC5|nr:hypothetical protein ASPCADRAFT_208448 [Aspergillus carbonarius ITEM 5010]